ncbi:hypothetical protein [Pseudooceanicola sp. HF7]|nr:hypothetical protein [Pseudooceanicola sp. HF7]
MSDILVTLSFAAAMASEGLCLMLILGGSAHVMRGLAASHLG